MRLVLSERERERERERVRKRDIWVDGGIEKMQDKLITFHEQLMDE